jgi:hypothetical protein
MGDIAKGSTMLALDDATVLAKRESTQISSRHPGRSKCCRGTYQLKVQRVPVFMVYVNLVALLTPTNLTVRKGMRKR